jgi:hypothetical protein
MTRRPSVGSLAPAGSVVVDMRSKPFSGTVCPRRLLATPTHRLTCVTWLSSSLMVEMVAALGGADCERIRSGWLAQPANALSSLTYLAVGVWLLWRSRASEVRRGVLLASGVAMVAVGVGSFAYHGPQPGWAHPAHDASIVALALVLVVDHVRLLARASRRRAAGAAAAGVMAAWRPAAPWVVLALVAYWAGRTGSVLCSPPALWQPHAAWHALSALGLGLAVAGRASRLSRCST